MGNPPYISHRDLDIKSREYIKKNFETCKNGKFDYCYAFIELSIKSLNNTGKLAYLIPSSIFKNVFAQDLRDFILPFTYQIIDFTTNKLFDDALTSSAFLLCQKKELSDTIKYEDVVHDDKKVINKELFINKWIFTNRNESTNKKRFGDYFHSASSIATLKNNVYVLKDFVEDEQFYINENYRIEKNVVRKAKSPRSLRYGMQEYIIFPYIYQGGSIKRYQNNDFELNFPECVKYLNNYKIELDNRKSDKSAQWFEYGRSQALAHLNQPDLHPKN